MTMTWPNQALQRTRRLRLCFAIRFQSCSAPGRRVAELGSLDGIARSMKFLMLLMVTLTGCSTPPSLLSAWNRFERKHPDAVVLRASKCEASGPSVGRPYAEFSFQYRDSAGVQGEEIWRYELGHHAWSRPVITKR